MNALERLAATIEARKTADPDSSWTAKLLAAGPAKFWFVSLYLSMLLR